MKNKYSYIFDRDFWRYAGARALHTISQTILGSTVATATTFGDVNWWVVLQTCVISAILSIAKSLFIGMPEMEMGEDE